MSFNSAFNAYMGPPSTEAFYAGAKQTGRTFAGPVQALTAFTSIFDPTPISDIFNAAALGMLGDTRGASLSMGAAMLPFIGGTELKTSTAVASEGWKFWRATARAGETLVHDKFGKFYKSGNLYFTKDLANHGGSAWKFYKVDGNMMVHFRDADMYGKFIIPKHKGPIGRSIPMNEFRGWGP